MALTVERIQYLGRKSVIKNAPELLDENTNDATPSAPKGMLTYLQMRRCLAREDARYSLEVRCLK